MGVGVGGWGLGGQRSRPRLGMPAAVAGLSPGRAGPPASATRAGGTRPLAAAQKWAHRTAGTAAKGGQRVGWGAGGGGGRGPGARAASLLVPGGLGARGWQQRSFYVCVQRVFSPYCGGTCGTDPRPATREKLQLAAGSAPAKAPPSPSLPPPILVDTRGRPGQCRRDQVRQTADHPA